MKRIRRLFSRLGWSGRQRKRAAAHHERQPSLAFPPAAVMGRAAAIHSPSWRGLAFPVSLTVALIGSMDHEELVRVHGLQHSEMPNVDVALALLL